MRGTLRPVHRRLAASIAEGRVQRHAGGREGRRRLPEHYTAIEPFGPTAVARALGHSSGAVGTCLEQLAGRGEVTRVGGRPRRYGPKAG
jgi:hypothetical protein